MSSKPANKKAKASDAKAIEERWTKPLADAGWTPLPNVVLEKQAALGLSPMDVNIILQIAKHWWERDSRPYPSVEAVAEAIGVKPRTVQRHVSKMVNEGLLERVPRFYSKGGQKSNEYGFDGLIKRCRPFAEEIVAERKRAQLAKRARVRRRSPRHVVKD